MFTATHAKLVLKVIRFSSISFFWLFILASIILSFSSTYLIYYSLKFIHKLDGNVWAKLCCSCFLRTDLIKFFSVNIINKSINKPISESRSLNILFYYLFLMYFNQKFANIANFAPAKNISAQRSKVCYDFCTHKFLVNKLTPLWK